MNYPSPMQLYNDWGEKIEIYWYSGNLELHWLKFIKINRNWWEYYKKLGV